MYSKAEFIYSAHKRSRSVAFHCHTMPLWIHTYSYERLHKTGAFCGIIRKKKKKIRFEITLRYLFILINTDKKQIILENI